MEVSDFKDLEILRYVLIAGFAFLVYDSLLCLGDEVRLIWINLFTRSRKTRKFDILAKLLYLFGRYSAILNCILILIALLPIHDNIGTLWAMAFLRTANVIITSQAKPPLIFLGILLSGTTLMTISCRAFLYLLQIDAEKCYAMYIDKSTGTYLLDA
ncbi:hypothetical protein PNOK_0153000 [Pyrrhoderma noxium]|uniref:DUF6533 domain-containing protein n=1 Tax=Pyrrhoderma noxium TaxID=2282107 RepID=A0A286UPQ0_9AGAM|nr:hypothetical protein PNOK_0153000 [Pyrrhoderma noxium]